MEATAEAAKRTSELYLDLIERCLTNTIYEDAYTSWRQRGVAKAFDQTVRQLGRDWPSCAHTMIGCVRLRNLRELAEQVLAEAIPGDFIETGVWRGGACILLRAVLKAHGVTGRRVYAADSFAGLPKPDIEHYPADAGDDHHGFEELAVSLEQVKANFAKYDLLDDQVVFLKGWFKDTLPAAPVEKLALLRLDGDMYESTMDALRHLYDKVTPGGFVIVDDYSCAAGCRKAVDDFRRDRGISEPIIDIDGCGVFWRKLSNADVKLLNADVGMQPPRGLEPVTGDGSGPFWSVIVPLYERRTYLKQCLESVLDQDPGPEEMEILVIDDASPSDLRGLVEGLGRGRVRYVRNATNLGLYPSTNAALRKSRGRWVHILHDDDWVMPAFYSTMKKGIETAPASVGAAFCMYVSWNEQDSTTWSPPPFRAGAGTMPRDFLLRLSVQNPLNLPAAVYRRKAFENVGLFREDLPFTADWEWYVRSALQYQWHYQPEVLARYRVHANSQTLDLTRTGQTASNVRRTLEIFAHYLPNDIAAQAMPAARRIHARQFLATALSYLHWGNRELANKFLFEALALNPDAPTLPEFVQLLEHPTIPNFRHSVRDDMLRRLRY